MILKKIALQIIKEEFGIQQYQLCLAIASDFNEQFTLQEIIKNINLDNVDANYIKTSLMILIKNQLVTFAESHNGVKYQFQPNNALQILRYPLYLNLIKNELGESYEQIIRYFFSNIIVSINDYLQKYDKKQRNTLKIQQMFENLQQQDFIVKVENFQQEEREEVEFQVPKKKQKISEIEENQTNYNISYKINFRKFITLMRNQEIEQIALTKINQSSYQIVSEILKNTKKYSRGSDVIQTEQYLVEDIQKLIESNSKLQKLTTQEIDLEISKLQQDQMDFICSKQQNLQIYYSINLKQVVKNMQLKHLSNFLERKYDSNFGRVFRILRKYKILNDKKVSDLALLPLKETLIKLNTLVKDGFLNYQELKEKEKPSSFAQLYIYNENQAIQNIVNAYYASIYNLREKYLSQVDQEKVNFDTFLKSGSLNKQQKEKYTELISLKQKLQMAILELNMGLMCFTEF